jgi:hypothetical protein
MSDETTDGMGRDAAQAGEPARCEPARRVPGTGRRRGDGGRIGGRSGVRGSRAKHDLVREVKNPYGGGPNTGITLPPNYRPTPSVANANTFFPGVEELGDDEMRISFIGSSPVPPTRNQAGTAIMVELGNGKRFFFDLGPGCLRNISLCRSRCRW